MFRVRWFAICNTASFSRNCFDLDPSASTLVYEDDLGATVYGRRTSNESLSEAVVAHQAVIDDERKRR